MAEDYEYANAFLVHAFPALSSIFNVLFFKVVYLKRHAKIPFFVVLIYLPFNYYGRFFYGHAVYYQSPLTDWSDPYVTLAITLAVAAIGYLQCYFIAVFTQWWHGYHEPTTEEYLEYEKQFADKADLREIYEREAV